MKIAAEEDLSKILGRHRWIDIMFPHKVEEVINKHRSEISLQISFLLHLNESVLPVPLANFSSDIYEYNFKYNGDPGTYDALCESHMLMYCF